MVKFASLIEDNDRTIIILREIAIYSSRRSWPRILTASHICNFHMILQLIILTVKLVKIVQPFTLVYRCLN